jgi:FkbM family methyltransferase
VTSLVMRAAALAARILPSPVKQALYRLGPVTDAIRAGLNRNAPAGMTVVRVAGGMGHNARLVLDLSTEKEIWLGTYEPELQAAIRRFGRLGMVAYDIGANIGYVTILLALTGGPGSQVFAFEPLPANLERLRSNIELNDLQDRVRAIPIAIGEHAGRSRFLVHASGGMGKLEGSDGRQTRYEDEIEVEMLALDDFIWERGNPPPDLIKIDIEGGETKAVCGMRRVFEESRPVILMEIHGPEAGLAVWDAFERADYRMYSMGHPERPIAGPQSLGWKAYVIGLPREWRDIERA